MFVFFSCSWGERAPPSGSTECVIIYSFRQVMVTNVTSLLKTVKAVEDEATRGTRALEATIEYVKQELTVRAPSGPRASSSCPSGSQPARRSLPRRADSSSRVRDICVCYSHENKGAFSLFFFSPFIICLAHFLPASLSVPAGFSLLLSGSGEKMQAEQEKQGDLCNLLFVI